MKYLLWIIYSNYLSWNIYYQILFHNIYYEMFTRNIYCEVFIRNIYKIFTPNIYHDILIEIFTSINISTDSTQYWHYLYEIFTRNINHEIFTRNIYHEIFTQNIYLKCSLCSCCNKCLYIEKNVHRVPLVMAYVYKLQKCSKSYSHSMLPIMFDISIFFTPMLYNS